MLYFTSPWKCSGKVMFLTVTLTANIVSVRGIYMSNGIKTTWECFIGPPHSIGRFLILLLSVTFLFVHITPLCLFWVVMALKKSRLWEDLETPLPGFLPLPPPCYGFLPVFPLPVSSPSSQPTLRENSESSSSDHTKHLLLLQPVCIGNLEWK